MYTESQKPKEKILRSLGFSDSQIRIFHDAKKNGVITSSEVLKIIPSIVFKDFGQMGAYLDRIYQVCEMLGIKRSNNGSSPHCFENGKSLTEFLFGRDQIKKPDPIEEKIRQPKRVDEVDLILKAPDESVEGIFDHVLKINEERRIGKNFELQYYLNEIGKIPNLPREIEAELTIQAQRGDLEARDKLISSSLRFVVVVAKRYRNRGLDLLDLIQEGNIGLMKSVEKFDPRLGFSIRTYGGWWIRQHITRAIQNQTGCYRLPVHIFDKVSQLKRVMASYRKKFQREPSIEELCSALEWKREVVAQALEIMNRKTEYIHEEDTNPKGGHGRVIIERIKNPFAPSPEEMTILKDELMKLHSLLYYILQIFSKKKNLVRNRNMFRMRFGLDGTCETKTLEEVGDYYHITRERVRQVVKKMMAKVHNNLKLKGKIPENYAELWLKGVIERMGILEIITKQEVLRSMKLEPE